MSRKIEKSEEEWREELGEERFRVCRLKGTEAPFTGALWDHHAEGRYVCAACKTPLFESTRKFDSGSGWPSFTAASDRGAVEEVEDRSHGMVRTEVLCRSCGSHLGHLFPDGPPPTGQRFCINSIALEFEPSSR